MQIKDAAVPIILPLSSEMLDVSTFVGLNSLERVLLPWLMRMKKIMIEIIDCSITFYNLPEGNQKFAQP
jgi:hypothetical protein